jgi:SH3-like domain-containing protein
LLRAPHFRLAAIEGLAMTMLRGLCALLVLTFLMLTPSAAADVDYLGYSYGGAEHCAVETEEMDMILIRYDHNNYSRIEKRLKPGECGIEVSGCHHGWCRVSQWKFDGWMHKDQLAAMSPPVYCIARGKRGWSVELREASWSSSKVVATISSRTCGISITPFSNGPWIRVKADGHYGWLKRGDIR